MADATSIRQLAKAVGVNASTATRWLKRPDFPVAKSPPWSDDDINEVKVWRRMCLQPNRAAEDYESNTNKDHWLGRRYRAQALKEEGKQVPVEAVERMLVRVMTELRERAEQVGPSTASFCVGKAQPEIERSITGAVIDLVEDIAARLGRITQSEADFSDWLQAVDETAQPDAEPVG